MKTANTKHKDFENKIVRKYSSLQFRPRGIPKHVLNRTLEIVNNPNDEFWLSKNLSCSPPIGQTSNAVKHSDSYKKLHLASKCLLTRDWQNLAKLLTSNLIHDNALHKGSYTVLSEYASIILTLEDPELLKKLKQTMASSNSSNNTNVESTEETLGVNK